MAANTPDRDTVMDQKRRMATTTLKNMGKTSLSSESSDQSERSSRGEHIINNGVLGVHKDIIDDFTRKKELDLNRLFALRDSTKLTELDRIYHDYFNPFPAEIKKNIQNEMIVDIDGNQTYFNRNAEKYGNFIHVIRQSAVNCMVCMYDGLIREASEHRGRMQTAMQMMVDNSLFVDTEALDYWKKTGKYNETMYKEAKQAVQIMFRGLSQNLDRWVETMKKYLHKN